ncbi:MAG: hypothetical protein K6E34_05895 [Lachnospiraceae bacterium]|nr:hypothetical protein [Lachnospiraceae bacterium]
MRKHDVIMKMHNHNGTLYRTMYEKDPFRYKRRIFIPTTGLNNIEVSKSIGDMIAETAEEVLESAKETVEAFVKTKGMIDGIVNGIKTEVIKEKKALLATAAEGVKMIIDSMEDED